MPSDKPLGPKPKILPKKVMKDTSPPTDSSKVEFGKSNLHPEKLTFEKFSERKRSIDDDSMSITKLLLYVVVVVVIGVGLTLGIQAFIKYQNDNKQSPPDTSGEETPASAITVDSQIKADNLASPAISADADFKKAEVTVGKKLTTAVSDGLTGFGYSRFTTVERLTFDFKSGIETPEAKVTMGGTQLLYVTFPNLITTIEELEPGAEYVKLTDTSTIQSVQNSSTTEKDTRISIHLTEAVTFVAKYSGNRLILDIRQADYVAQNPDTETPTDEPDPEQPTTGEGTKPAAPHYDNTYSKNTQFISSSYTGNKLRVYNYTYRDYGDRYEFKFRVKDDGSGVNPKKPNVKAYLNEDAAAPKLIVEISNINWEILDQYLKSDCFDAVAYGNVRKICGEFDAKKSMVTYEIHLYKLADFEVDSVDNTQYDAERPGEVIWIKIKDN